MTAIVATLLATTVVHWAPCPAYDFRTSCADPANGVIWVLPEDWRNGDLEHELGHIFDARYLRPWSRARFEEITRDTRPWGDQGAALNGEPNPPREQFAEAFRLCSMSTRRLRDTAGYLYEPTTRQHRRVCRLIVDAFRTEGDAAR
jgi:hypothetical protein